jgi:hypothetical protein
MLTVTYSDIQTFVSCPRAWWFKSFLRLQPRKQAVTGALSFGSRIHAALERGERGEDTLQVWDSLIDTDMAVLLSSGFSSEDLEKEDRLGRIMLEGFLDWQDETGFHEQYETESVETALSMPLEIAEYPEADVLLRGKLDRVLRRRSDGATFIGDYKTIGTFSERDLGSLQRSSQPRIYSMLLQHARPDEWVGGVVYSLLRKVQRSARSNPPFFQTLTVPLTAFDVEQHRVRIEGVTGTILRTVQRLTQGEDHRRVVPFSPSWQCSTCPFRVPCGLMQDTSLEAADDFLLDNYEVGDPYARYEETTE